MVYKFPEWQLLKMLISFNILLNSDNTGVIRKYINAYCSSLVILYVFTQEALGTCSSESCTFIWSLNFNYENRTVFCNIDTGLLNVTIEVCRNIIFCLKLNSYFIRKEYYERKYQNTKSLQHLIINHHLWQTLLTVLIMLSLLIPEVRVHQTFKQNNTTQRNQTVRF